MEDQFSKLANHIQSLDQTRKELNFKLSNVQELLTNNESSGNKSEIKKDDIKKDDIKKMKKDVENTKAQLQEIQKEISSLKDIFISQLNALKVQTSQFHNFQQSNSPSSVPN